MKKAERLKCSILAKKNEAIARRERKRVQALTTPFVSSHPQKEFDDYFHDAAEERLLQDLEDAGYADNAQDSDKKKLPKTRCVKWADTSGGELTEVFTFTPHRNHKRYDGSTYSPRTLALNDLPSRC